MMLEGRKQVITGVVPPQVGEAVIRTAWPSVTAFPMAATAGRALLRTFVLAPLGWLCLAPIYFLKVLPLPGLRRRFVLTNRRLMFQKGPHLQPVQEISLEEIDEITIEEDGNSEYFGSANLHIISQGQTRLTLYGVPNPRAFREAVLNACKAWVPGKAAKLEKFVSASSATAASKAS